LYQSGDYDLAGFCVGVVERRKVIDGRAIVPGDLIIGIASSGLHSNGYSLVRKIVFEIAGLKIGNFVDELGRTVGEALLEPTRIYVRAIRRVLKHYPVKSVVHGLAHITGGGLLENIERILPQGTRGTIDRESWPVPPIFRWLRELGDVDQAEMDQVFNMGIGMALIVSPFYAESIRAQLNDLGLSTWQIGRIDTGERGMSWGK
jgi:phosphoribosylformylglycinamidine cyclo-ligase